MTKQVKRTICTGSAHGAATPMRRGVALMLVVVAMGTATVLTTAYLVSKDNSAAIGANAQDTAASEWAARSGADLALAILQTEEDWVDAEPESLLEGFSIASGTVSIVLSDLGGNPPDGTETELAMTVVADVNGVKTVLQRIVSILPDADLELAVDAELGEFGIFATDQLSVELDSEIEPWPESPGFKSGAPVKIGAGFTNGTSLLLDADSSMTSTELYVRPDAAGPLKAMVESEYFSGGEVLQVNVPAILPRLSPTLLSSLPNLTDTDIVIDKTYMSVPLPGGRYAGVTIANPGVRITLNEELGGVYQFDSLTLDTESELLIKGDVTVVVGSMTVSNGATVDLVGDQSSVRFFVGNQLTVVNAGIGVPTVVARDTGREMDDIEFYLDPRRIRFYAMATQDGGVASPRFVIDNNSLVIMAAHAPTAQIMVRDKSSVIGRLTGAQVVLRDDASLFYDPVLDSKVGFTVPESPYYKSTGEPIDGLVVALDSYDITQGLDAFRAYLLAQCVEEIDSVVIPGPGDPTPRDGRQAIEKPWPFGAMALEVGRWVTGDNGELQENLYVPLDPSIFDLDQFYNDGVINATYTQSGTQNLAGMGAMATPESGSGAGFSGFTVPVK